MPDVTLRSPITGGTIVVSPDLPGYAGLLLAGFTRVEPPEPPPSKKEKRSHV